MRSGVVASTRRFFVDLYVIFKNRVLTDSGTFIENPIEFNNGMLLLTPNAYKENKIYSALPLDGSGDFTFSRNSSATYIEEGIIKTAQANVPRIQDGKILIEGQSTNIIKNSEVFSSYGTVAIINESPLPSPIKSTSYLFNDGTDDNRHRLITPFNPILGLTYTYTYILKKADSDWVQICLQSPHFPLEVWANFNLSTGEIGNEGEQGVGKIESLGNGWYKCSVTGVCIYDASSSYPHIMATNNINSGRYPRYIGTNMDCFYIACVQLEEGNKATSYIPTNGTAATRLADIATVTPPTGVTEIIETIDGVEQSPITTIPPTYQLPDGEINKVIMQ